MLVCYARELKEHFVEYAEETVRLMVRQNNFYFYFNQRTKIDSVHKQFENGHVDIIALLSGSHVEVLLS